MKTITYLFFAFLLILSGRIQAQLIADAGPDTICCVKPDFWSTQIGGNPTASGGVPPYTYTWDASYTWTIGSWSFTYTASLLLDDTTIANPSVISNIETDDWIDFVLTVEDSENNISRDTMKVRFSQYAILLAYFTYNIQQGDSVYLNWGVNLSGGIPPYEYLWRPNHGLTDSTSLSFWAKPEHDIKYYVIMTDSAGCEMIGPEYYHIYVSPVGINEHTGIANSVKIFPNPSSDFVNVKVENEEDLPVEFLFYDLTGKLILRRNLTKVESAIDIQRLKPGIYHAIIRNDERPQFHEKVIIQGKNNR